MPTGPCSSRHARSTRRAASPRSGTAFRCSSSTDKSPAAGWGAARRGRQRQGQSPRHRPAASASEDLEYAVAHAPVLGREAPAWAEGSGTSLAIPEGERKQVTILCCALADARGLATRVGAEAMYRLMRAFLALAQRVVQRYAGTLMQRLSD